MHSSFFADKRPVALLTTALLLTLALLFQGCATGKKETTQEEAAMRPAVALSTAPLAESEVKRLAPGLATAYHDDYFARDVQYLPPDGDDWRQGPPVTNIDHQFEKGEVFASGTNRGIGVRLRGALYFAEAGSYALQALSNDGVMLWLEEQLVLSDPRQHADRLSEVRLVMVDTPGWYPLRIDYFQRKGTAALRLFWQPPGTATMQIIPATAYGHLPGAD